MNITIARLALLSACLIIGSGCSTDSPQTSPGINAEPSTSESIKHSDGVTVDVDADTDRVGVDVDAGPIDVEVGDGGVRVDIDKK